MKKHITIGLVGGALLIVGYILFTQYSETGTVSENSTDTEDTSILDENVEQDVITVINEENEEVVFDTSDWLTFSNDTYGFSFKYPPEYEVYEPEVNNQIRGNEYTEYIFSVRKKGMKNDIGHAFYFDTQEREISKRSRNTFGEKPEEYVVRTIDFNEGDKLMVFKYVHGAVDPQGFTMFTLNNLYVRGTFVLYPFTEFQAILSTFRF